MVVGAAIFDLDGVLVDTARLHFAAWQRLARSLGFELHDAQNERLKGVSRERSLLVVLACGQVATKNVDLDRLADQKNAWYVESLNGIGPKDVIPGALSVVEEFRDHGLRTAIASGSRNARTIVERTRIGSSFDAIVDGSLPLRSKPAPDLFVEAALRLHVTPAQGIVFEDAVSGVVGAKAAGMYAVGVGRQEVLTMADWVVPTIADIDVGVFLARRHLLAS